MKHISQTFAAQYARFLSLCESTPELTDYVKNHRLNLDALSQNGIALTVALCQGFDWFDGSRGFQFSDDVTPCLVIEARTFENLGGVIEPVARDLIAWPLGSPESFATICGPNDGMALLGADFIAVRQYQSVRLFETPLNWLKANCEGSCVIKSGAQPWLIRHGGPFKCESTDLAEWLRKTLGNEGKLIAITAPKSQSIQFSKAA